ncbi:4259_t:CDS:2 [Rhizophagus irregularis]|nr:4259_t:CDS:2 [Rhizophagus irregularis]
MNASLPETVSPNNSILPSLLEDMILRAYWDEEIQEVKGVPHQVIVCKVIDTANQTPCRKHILSLSGSTAKRSRKARYEEFRQCLVDWIINDFQQLDHYSSDKDLPKSIVDRLDKKILKALVMAGIPFSVIEIPFILNLFKDLRSGYSPPSRTTVSSYP